MNSGLETRQYRHAEPGKIQAVSAAARTPPEVLSMLFKIMYSDARQQDWNGWEYLSDSELLSPFLFPYSVSRVCKAWDRAASLHPGFWTRIVIRLDLSKPVEAFALYLKRAKNRALDSIYIAHTSDIGVTSDDDREGEVVSQLATLLGKRYTRCKSLRILAKYSDSIIKILPICLPEQTNKLEAIELQSHKRSHHRLDPLPVFPLADGAVTAPNLRRLSLIGPHYIRMFRDKHWRDAMSTLYLKLTISHLRMEDGGSKPFQFSELWTSFTHFKGIGSLTLVNVDIPNFDSDEQATGDRWWREPAVDAVELRNVTSSVLGPLLTRIKEAHLARHISDESGPYVDHLAFDNCSFFNCQIFPAAGFVKIRNILNPDTLSLAFARINTEMIVISDCPGFDNSSLASLTIPVKSAIDRGDFEELPLSNTRAMWIHNCPNVSLLGLREVAKFRVAWPDTSNEIYGRNQVWPKGIDRIRLSGSTPTPSVEEVHWFKKQGTKVTHTEALDEDAIWYEEEEEGTIEEEEEDRVLSEDE
ncbi:hypothetical protein BKA70DRAFT_1563005 [Coprinopsis sp. MPI-PUGE-AT-0042]|nr:hypothetical protein BKA70DRAFT_1563005 [Coprinopsis sp. MPI-PUGE-AT-0042]